jgi:hypothetical protein
VQTLSAAGQDASWPQVAVDRNGSALVVWSRSDGANYRIEALSRTAAGSLSTVLTLSAAGQNAANAQLEVDRNGNAVVVWERYDGANSRIQASYLLEVQTLSVGAGAVNPDAAVDRNGNAVVVWQQFDGANSLIQVRRRTAAGNLSAVQTLSAAGEDAYDPDIALDRNGNAVVAWSRYDGSNYRIQARRRTASGSLSAVKTLSEAGQNARDPQLAVDPDGNAVVVWTRSDGANYRIQARRRSASGSLSAVQTLSPAGQDAGSPQVAVDPDGNAVVVWIRSDGANFRIQARRRAESGGLSAVQDLSAAGQHAEGPQLAMDRSGRALVVWQRYDGTHIRIQARRRTASGNLSAVQTLSEAGQNAVKPQVAVDPDGNAVVVWEGGLSSDHRIRTRRRTAAGTLSPVQILSPAGQFAENPQVAVDGNGKAVVVWTLFDGANNRIQARRRAAAGSLSAVQTLSAAGQDANNPRVAVDQLGNAVMAWERFDGAYYRVQAGRLRAG